MNKITKILFSLVLCAVILLPAFNVALGESAIIQNITDSGIGSSLGGTTDIKIVIGNIITFLLGLLGIVLVILIIYAGFVWMTAGGDSAKVDTAKGLIKNAIIGIIIIIAAYGISVFVIKNVLIATGGSSAP